MVVMECRYFDAVAFTRYLIPSVVLLKAEGEWEREGKGMNTLLLKWK